MNSFKYGTTEFSFPLNFKSCTLFSDIEPKQHIKDKSIPRLSWRFFRIGEKEGKNVILLDDEITAEYAMYFSGDNDPSGYLENVSFSFSPVQLTELSAYMVDLTADKIAYYAIGENNYIKLDGAVNLDAIELVAESAFGRKPPVAPVPAPFFTTLFVSKDGAKLLTAANTINNISPKEVILFVEVGDQNYFGSVIRALIGEEVVKVPQNALIEVAEILASFNSETTATDLSEVINETVEDRGSFFTMMKAYSHKVGELIKWPSDFFEGQENLFESMIDLTNQAKFGSDRWQSFIDGKPNPKFKPLLPRLSDITGDWDPITVINDLKKTTFDELENKFDRFTDFLNKSSALKRLMGDELERFKKRVFVLFDLVISRMLQYINDASQLGFDFMNAFVVGLINSIISIFEGIFFLLNIAWELVKFMWDQSVDAIFNVSEYIAWWIEVLENIFGLIDDLFSDKTLDALSGFFGKVWDKTWEGLGILFDSNSETSVLRKLPADDIGYFAGFIVGFIVEEVILLLATGGAGNISQALAKLGQSFAKITSSVASKAVKVTKGAITTTTQVFLKSLQSAKGFISNLPTHIKSILAWLDDWIIGLRAKLVVNGPLTFAVIDPFSASALWLLNKIRRIGAEKLKRLSISILKNEEGAYKLVYTTVEDGVSKQHVINDFVDKDNLVKELEDILKKSDGEIKKWLDNVIERKVALDDLIKELGEEFLVKQKKHWHGELKLTPKTDKLGRPYFKKKGIGGHSYQAVLDGNLQIKGATIPPNPGNDEPFIALLKMFDESNPNSYVNKANSTIRIEGKQQRMASTMFPKNWNDLRISEEVAFAYKNKKPVNSMQQGDVLVETFQGTSTTGMKIDFIYNDGILKTTPPVVK